MFRDENEISMRIITIIEEVEKKYNCKIKQIFKVHNIKCALKKISNKDLEIISSHNFSTEYYSNGKVIISCNRCLIEADIIKYDGNGTILCFFDKSYHNSVPFKVCKELIMLTACE